MFRSLRLLPFCLLILAVLVAPASAAQKKTAAAQNLTFDAAHGCVRLTNWDALELARHVSGGTPVTIGERAVGRQARRHPE
jgi:hypothetical protein